MKPPSDWQKVEGTAPGQGDPGEPDSDEFPSEQTRIDTRGSAETTGQIPRTSPGKAKGSSGAPEPAEKLRALQSLSMQRSGGPSAGRASGGSSRLPWILLGIVVTGVIVHEFVPTARFWKGGGAKGGRNAGGSPGMRIEVVHPSSAGGGQALLAAGYIAARTPISVGVATGGRVEKVVVANGDKVKQGQVIVQLDSSQARAEMVLALAKKRDAERLLARARSLYRAQAATQTDLDRAVGQADIARAELRPIEQRISQSKIHSPIHGTVIEVLVHPGEVIASNGSVVKLADLSELVAEVEINEGDLVKIRRGQKVDLSSEAFAGRSYAGTVREISEQADRARGTVMVKVDLQVPDQSLRPGMSVKCSFQPNAETQRPRILLPKRAVLAGGAVWVVGPDQTVSRRQVSTQPAGPSAIEVSEGLKEGERVVVEGFAELQDGQKLP